MESHSGKAGDLGQGYLEFLGFIGSRQTDVENCPNFENIVKQINEVTRVAIGRMRSSEQSVFRNKLSRFKENHESAEGVSNKIIAASISDLEKRLLFIKKARGLVGLKIISRKELGFEANQKAVVCWFGDKLEYLDRVSLQLQMFEAKRFRPSDLRYNGAK